jgi:hypothetical protein
MPWRGSPRSTALRNNPVDEEGFSWKVSSHVDARHLLRPQRRRSGGRCAWLALVAGYSPGGGAHASMVKRT